VRRSSPALLIALAFGVVIVLAGIALVWGQSVVTDDARIFVTPPGFHGEWELASSPLLWTILVGGLIVLAGAWGIWTDRLPDRWIPAWAAVASAAWMTGLAASEGRDGVNGPLEASGDYLPVLDEIDGIGTFLSTYTDRLADYPIHVKGHPPGFAVVLWLLDQLGLEGSGWAAALTITVAASGVAALVIAVRAVTDESTARWVAPLVGVGPWVVWAAVSADGFIGGVVCWCVAACALATRTSSTRRAKDIAAVVAGLLAGMALMLTYGAPLMLLPAGSLLITRRDRRSIGLAAVGGAAVILGFAASGFWWLDGLATTRDFYESGVASRRPYLYFFIANLVVVAAILGPATIAGLALLRDRRVWAICGASLLGVFLADLSGLSKAEVERIWIPFAMVVGLAVVGAITAFERRKRAAWILLGAQMMTGVIWELTLDTGW
jgi:hypothetical protein